MKERFYIMVAGVHWYHVIIPDQIMYNLAGDEISGFAIESRRLILISHDVAADQREEVLGHEVEHAWSFHVPEARNAEERAQLTATILQSMRQDLQRQGGIKALRKIAPEPIKLPYRKGGLIDFTFIASALAGVENDPWLTQQITLALAMINGATLIAIKRDAADNGITEHQIMVSLVLGRIYGRDVAEEYVAGARCRRLAEAKEGAA